MRIAMFMPGLSPHSLGWQVHQDFAQAMRDVGHPFTMLVTPGADGRVAPEDQAQTLPVPSWSAVAGRVAAPLLRATTVMSSVAALANHLRVSGRTIDMLHAEVAYPVAASVALAVRWSGWKGHLAITPTGEDVLVVADAAYGFRRHAAPRRLVDWTLRQATCIRCLSPLLEAHVAPLAEAIPRRVVPLSVSWATVNRASESDDELARARRTARAAVDDRCRSHGRPLIMAYGRLHPFKGLDLLVRAMAAVPDAVLAVVGPSLHVRPLGDTAAGLRQLAESLGIAERVHILGAVPPARATEMLAAADVVGVPSHLESFNKVCIEAAAVGTPFVVTETTGISASLTEPGVGRVVPPRDPEALAAAIADIVQGRWHADRAAAARFVDQFRPDRVAAEVAAFYESVTGDETDTTPSRAIGQSQPGSGA